MGRAVRPKGSATLRSERITTSGRLPEIGEEALPSVFVSEERKLNPAPEADQALYQDAPVEDLLPYIEFDRLLDPGAIPYHQKLIDSIAENGVVSGLIMVYNPETGIAYIAEGNHRLGIARHLGISNVPVQVRAVEGSTPSSEGTGGRLVPRPLSVEEVRQMGGRVSLADLGIGEQLPKDPPGDPLSGDLSPKKQYPEGPLGQIERALEEGGNKEDVDCSGLDLSGREFFGSSESYLHNARFTGSNLAESHFQEVDLVGASFERANLARAKFENLDASGASWSGVKWGGTDFKKVDLEGASFSGDISGIYQFDDCRFDRASFSFCSGRGVDFNGEGEGASWSHGKWYSGDAGPATRWSGDFPEASFEEADIRGCVLEGSVLAGSNFRKVRGDGADWSQCDLQGCDWTEASCPGALFDGADMSASVWKDGDFTGASFQEARLLGEDLSEVRSLQSARFDRAQANAASFRELDLSETSFQGAHLEEASFDGARLDGANFQGAYAYGASFNGVCLAGVDFRGACLAGADLRGARNLDQALLEGCDFKDAQLPEGFSLPSNHQTDSRWL